MGAIERVFRGRRGGQERPAAAIVARLWRNGEQGVWYDPSDLSTMFQDTAGALPCYMPGQGQVDPPIGLQLDKRFGLALGPELCANGSFQTDVSGWTRDIAWASPGIARVTTSAISGPYQQISTTPGRRYRVSARVITSSVTARVRVCTDTSLVTTVAETADVSAGRLDMSFLATSATSTIYLRNSAAGISDWGAVSVRELPGNHRWQGTATSRPTLSARYNLLAATESAAAWGKAQAGSGAPPVITENASISPTGTTTAIRVQFNRGVGTMLGDYSLVVASISAMGAASTTTRSVFMRSATGSNQQVVFYDSAQTVGRVVTVTPDWQQVFLYGGNPNVNSSIAIGSRGGAGYNTGGDTAPDIYLWGCDVRVSNDGVGLPSYQRVLDANTYDTVGFPLYRKPDGVDDWMQTASVDFSGTTKITVATAMRKISDTARAVAIEMGQFAENISGNFSLEAPSAAPGNILARASGTSSLNAVQAAPLPAPASAVVQARLDSAVGVSLRVNGGAWSENKIAFGGAFVNSPIYFDRRGGTTLPSGARDYGTLIVGRLLTGPETAAVEKYLRQKSRAY